MRRGGYAGPGKGDKAVSYAISFARMPGHCESFPPAAERLREIAASMENPEAFNKLLFDFLSMIQR
jgi:hypothetical protein